MNRRTAVCFLLPLMIFASSCGNEPVPTPPVQPKLQADPLTEKAAAARKNLATFYLNTFGPMIRSGHYDRELPVARLDHYAHRLWVPDRDWTYDEALKTLAPLAQHGDLEIKRTPSESYTARVAYFTDNHQLHRDQYAMIASEMKIGAFGDIPIKRFVTGAMIGYGTKLLTSRVDHPWTVILLSTNLPPAEIWQNGNGELVRVDGVIRGMIDAPFFPPERHELACYDYHTVYALAAAVRAGYSEFADEARFRMRQAFDRGARVCGESFMANPESMEAIVGRIKLNGHLVEAYFRGGYEIFPKGAFRADVERSVNELLRDSEKLRDLNLYEGPPDVFVAVPHAIHGLDLALEQLRPKD